MNAVIHGPAKVGKSWLSDTVPGPRLILDAEGGSRFTPSGPKLHWDAMTQAVPEAPVDGNWETCIVNVTKYDQLERVYDILVSGNHPFKSVVLDQLSEIQMRCVSHFVGKSAMQTQDWGTLLREIDDLVRKYRDLAIHPTSPLAAVIFNVQTTFRSDKGKWTPALQGDMRNRLPYMVDMIGYMSTAIDETSGETVRKLLINPTVDIEAGDRTDKLTRHYGSVITNPDFSEMLAVLNA